MAPHLRDSATSIIEAMPKVKEITGVSDTGITCALLNGQLALARQTGMMVAALSNDPDQEEGIARAILHYLSDHPDAKDSLEGIAQWWLLREWTEARLVEVERAVTVLLSDGLIVETRRKGAPPYYKLNRSRVEEISRILESNQDPYSTRLESTPARKE